MMDARQKIQPLADIEFTAGTLVLGGGYLLLQAAHCRRFAEARESHDRVVAAIWDDPGLATLRPAASRAHLVAAARDADAVFICTPDEWQTLKCGTSGAQFEELDPTVDMSLVAAVLGKQQAAKA